MNQENLTINEKEQSGYLEHRLILCERNDSASLFACRSASFERGRDSLSTILLVTFFSPVKLSDTMSRAHLEARSSKIILVSDLSVFIVRFRVVGFQTILVCDSDYSPAVISVCYDLTEITILSSSPLSSREQCNYATEIRNFCPRYHALSRVPTSQGITINKRLIRVTNFSITICNAYQKRITHDFFRHTE